MALISGRGLPAAEGIYIDLSQWISPDITSVADDPFGRFVKYGHTLFTDTANEIGPGVSDPTRRFAGNNLACQNCHLQAGRQPYAMPLTGVWGQFPQYRAREGAVVTRLYGAQHKWSRPAPRKPRDEGILCLYAVAIDRYSRRCETGGSRHVENPRTRARCRSWPRRAGFFPDMRTLPRGGWTRTARPKRGRVSVSTALGP